MTLRRFSTCFLVLLWLAALNPRSLAFDGHKVAQGPLTLLIEPMDPITRLDAPVEVKVSLASTQDAPLAVSLELGGLLDTFKAIGPVKKQVQVSAKGKAEASFQIAALRGTYSALYPVHAWATFTPAGESKAVTAHAVLIVATDLKEALASEAPKQPPVIAVPAAGALVLYTLKTQQITWNIFGQGAAPTDPPKSSGSHPVGWQGGDQTTGLSFAKNPVARGETRQAINMHPPYRAGVGTVFANYRVQLPNTTPIKLAFFNAIRDSTPKEGKSDGVTFRVWADDKILFDRHTDSKTWLPGEADLSAYAGKIITLRLESHPGLKKNTSCDSSFWGDPLIYVGKAPAVATPEQRQQAARAAVTAAQAGQGSGDKTLLFNLGPASRAAIVLGPNGIVDGGIALLDQGKVVAFEGMDTSIADNALGRWPSAVVVQSVDVQASQATPGGYSIVHHLKVDQQSFDLLVTAWAQGPALRLKIECPQRISAIANGLFDRKAARAYAGHGYCMENPQSLRLGGGGHTLAASHVGFDFDGGLSLIIATDVPPDFLKIDAERKEYSLQTHPASTFTFVPSAIGATDALFKYRPLCDKKASPGYVKKAGRFVFDIWGGKYAEVASAIARCADYGMTDSLVMFHNWQRWGYDYRLPDIYPPAPGLGTLEDMQELVRTCTSRGILFGLHDNYIDIYPDATDFSYDHVTFSVDGNPRRAWLNNGRDAQSYQFRPDHIMPFVKRNLDLVAPSIKPTSFFVDVFTSANIMDYYDRSGAFHSRIETQKCWGEAMAAMRQAFGNDAPGSSEAGSDQLIGWLDGADCQLIQLSPKPRMHGNAAVIHDYDFVPWFDSIYHDRFSLHGVGYSNRYQGQRSRSLHGIESDDYISAEILTGHALMIDKNPMVRGGVRKYWLAQALIRKIATDSIAGWQLADNDIHRVIVTWKSGAKMYVNRGAMDWTVEGKVLPQYGYCAVAGDVRSSIEKIGDVVVEQSSGPGTMYVNARGADGGDPVLAIRAAAGKLEYLGERKFKLPVYFDAQQPTIKPLNPFVHIHKPQVSRLVREGFGLPLSKSPVPSTQWKGRIALNEQTIVTIPPDVKPGEYEILAGLVDPRIRGFNRQRMLGDEDAERRYRVGRLIIEGQKDQITGLRFEPAGPEDPIAARALAPKAAADFGAIKTIGGVRCEFSGKQLKITPLPDSLPFDVTLRLDKLLPAATAAKVRQVQAINAKGEKLREVRFKQADELTFTTMPEDFGYRITLE